MPATATNPTVDSIDRDLAELQQRRTEARRGGEKDRELVLTAAITHQRTAVRLSFQSHASSVWICGCSSSPKPTTARTLQRPLLLVASLTPGPHLLHRTRCRKPMSYLTISADAERGSPHERATVRPSRSRHEHQGAAPGDHPRGHRCCSQAQSMTEPFGPWHHNRADIGPINHDVSLHPWITTLRHRFVTRLGEQFDRALTAIICKRSKP